MKALVFGSLMLLVFSCKEFSKTEFSLNGSTRGIENGTVLYLDNYEVLIDSAVVENNSFYFNTKLPESPFQVILRTKSFSNYRFLWLENNPMSFDATQTDFRNANVSGSFEEDLSQTLRQQTESLPRDERLIKEIDFVNKHPNSIHSAYMLSVYSKTWGKEKTKELFDKFSNENKNTRYGRSIAKFIKLNKNPEIGEHYVNFEMVDTNGEIRRLSEVKNKLVLLEFWASNCAPCRIENPNLVKTYERFKPKGFEIFAVSLDTKKENWLEAIEKDELPWLQVSDLKGENNLASLIYGVHAIPDNFLIDQNGIIIERNLREEKLNEKLHELLN